MRKTILIAYLLFTGHLVQAQLTEKISNFPSYEEVVEHFYAEYMLKQRLDQMSMIRFARKPNGWYLMFEHIENQDVMDSVLLWNSTGYKTPKYFMKKNGASKGLFELESYQDKEAQMEEYLLRMFRIHTFFGYPGWADDIVQHLATKRNQLNDADLYSLGRGYSGIKSAMLIKNHRAGVKYSFTLDKLQNNLDDGELALYYAHLEGAESCFKQLAIRNPNFHTVAGKIQTKYANEVVQGYVDLWLVQNETLAKAHLISNIYPPEILSNARNYLRNCLPSSILISNGDNDTYPLWYVQATENFRPDVSVVNPTLLWDDRYMQAIRRGMNGFTVNFSIDTNQYSEMKILYLKTNGATKDVFEFIKQIGKYLNENFNTTTLKNLVYVCPRTPDNPIETPFKTYYYKTEIALLDMFLSNSRTLAFTQTEPFKTIFANRFVLRGVVHGLDFCYSDTIDHNAFYDFLYQMEVETYLDTNNFPRKPNNTEFMDDVFLQTIYSNLYTAMKEAKNASDPEQFKYYKTSYLNMLEKWAVKPELERQRLFTHLIETD